MIWKVCFLSEEEFAHNKFVASKVNNERKLPGHSCVYTVELQQISSTKGNATSSHCAFTQLIGSHSANVVQLYSLPSPFSL
jgi:hypothetical protein